MQNVTIRKIYIEESIHGMYTVKIETKNRGIFEVHTLNSTSKSPLGDLHVESGTYSYNTGSTYGLFGISKKAVNKIVKLLPIVEKYNQQD